MTEDLSVFRKKIDAIDDEIVDLLKKRLKVVKQVGKHKAKTSATQSFIRAGREANMIRDLTKKIGGAFPPAAVASIWRTIISASLCLEQDMSIAAYVSKSNDTCFWLAREYYGAFVHTDSINSADDVISAVSTGKSSIGILPLNDKDCPWWVRPEGEKNTIYVFARIPFVEDSSQPLPPALAIANVMPESTDEDSSILVAKGFENDADIINLFKKHDVVARIIAKHGSEYLIETDHFIDQESTIFSDNNNLTSEGKSLRLMGSYARPITL